MKNATITLSVFLIAGLVQAEPKIIDRAAEAKNYPDLQATERAQETNVVDSYKALNQYAPIVALASKDRATAFKEKAEPLKFENTFRFVKLTQMNTYVRYVKETPEFMLSGMGDPKVVLELINAKTKQANDAGIVIPTFQFQGRDGIELTQFSFIYREEKEGKFAVGSRRKSMLLFYKAGAGTQADSEQTSQLDLVVTRIVEDNFAAGIKHVELIIDPTPLTPNMDDVITLHRYNFEVTTCVILGTMSNNPANPDRVLFKKQFYVGLLDHFNILYRMVDTYAKRDGNDVNEKTINRMSHSMDY